MPDIAYKLFFNDSPASSKSLDRVEEITVAQEVDMAWEARLKIPVCLDEKGNWKGIDEDFMKSFARVRVEIRAGKNPFVPLIDGPVVGFDSEMNASPGRSHITLIAQDDSVYLNRREDIKLYEQKLDHEIARQIFQDFGFRIDPAQIDPTPASGSADPRPVVQRGTAISILRSLAKRQGMHAYVLPGENPGDSVGCFRDFPVRPEGLPPLVLLGQKRNIDTFNVRNNAQSPSDVHASTMRFSDRSIVSRSIRHRDVELMGEESALEDVQEPAATQVLEPRQGGTMDLRQATAARARRTSYAYEATGKVRTECYGGILRPYQVVTVQAGNMPQSGDYIIFKVEHSLTRSVYSQSFSLKRNAKSRKHGPSSINPARRIS